MGEPLAGGTKQFAFMHLADEGLHLQQFGGGDLRGVFPPAWQIRPESTLCAIAQRHVHCRATFGGIDHLALEQPVTKQVERSHAGKAEQGGEGFCVYGGLGEINGQIVQRR